MDKLQAVREEVIAKFSKHPAYRGVSVYADGNTVGVKIFMANKSELEKLGLPDKINGINLRGEAV